MKTIAVHPIFQLEPRKRSKKTFLTNQNNWERMWNKREMLGWPKRWILTFNDIKLDKIAVNIEQDKLTDMVQKEAYIQCDCGFKGNYPLKTETLDKGYVCTTTYHVQCPTCGRRNFDIQSSEHYDKMKLKFAEIFRDENKITLSFAFQNYRFESERNPEKREYEVVNTNSFETLIRLTYNHKKRTLYWIQPRQKIIRNISYGNLHDLQMFFLNELSQDERGNKQLHRFLKTCFLLTDIHPKKIKMIFEQIDKYSIHLFSRDRNSLSKILFPLLAMPQLEALEDENFIISMPTAPRRIKEAIKKSEPSIKSIFQNMFGFSSKRLLRYYNQDAMNLIVVDLFSPLFKNKELLMDVVWEIKDTSLSRKAYEYDIEMIHTRVFLLSKNVRKSYLPLLRKFKKLYKDEMTFRNVLMELLQSPICGGNFGKFIQYFEDILQMQDVLLTVVPEYRLPKRTSLIALHDACAKLLNEKADILKERDKEENGYHYDDVELALEEKGEQFSIELVQMRAELVELGVALNNCVGGYDMNVRNRYSYILSLKEESQSRVCIELKRYGDEWSLVQCSAWENQRVPTRYMDFVRGWANKHQMNDQYQLLKENDYIEETRQLVAQQNLQNALPFVPNQHGIRAHHDENYIELDLPF